MSQDTGTVAAGRGGPLLVDPAANKDTAFDRTERDANGLRGLLPYGVSTIEQQVALELKRVRRKSDNLERYIGLAALQDRNETLFYRLLLDHLEELAPIIYTPTVGEACRQFSVVQRRPRGLWITPDDIDQIPDLLDNVARPDVRLIVVTDNERILGLGDLGAGGMGIPIGKLALYSVGAGVRPSYTLAVSLDCGTDNEELLRDPMYLGYPKTRLRGPGYDAFIEAFVQAVVARYPDVLLQWEDFKQNNALRLLERYRHRVASFNDDIQGTAAVVVAGLLAALRARDETMASQRIVFLGAGAAGIGIARLVEAVMREETAEVDPRHSILMLDSRGLIMQGRDGLDPEKASVATPSEELQRYGFPPAQRYDLETVVRHVAPTVLIGTAGTAGAFTQGAIREMAARVPAPIVLPLSNPTANAEAAPADIFAWSQGRAVVATGSPFAPVDVGGRTRLVGQANNVLIFPGVGLGALAVRAQEITDRMFLVAARTLAGLTSNQRLADGALYPPLSELRRISRAIAIAVAREACQAGLGRIDEEAIESAVDESMWVPDY